MTPLNSKQMQFCATPRRGNLVHKLTANFRDPMQLDRAQFVGTIRSNGKKLAELLKNVPPITQEYFNEVKAIITATPANSAEL